MCNSILAECCKHSWTKSIFKVARLELDDYRHRCHRFIVLERTEQWLELTSSLEFHLYVATRRNNVSNIVS